MSETSVWLLDWFAQRRGLVQGSAEDRLKVDYFQQAVLDSMGVIELIGDIESHFAFQFTDRHFQDRRFSIIGGLAELITELGGAQEEKMTGKDTAIKDWVDHYNHCKATGETMWPCETLVRLFKGTYVPNLDRNHTGKKVLDVGCGGGNNLVFLASLGLELHGTEIDEAVCVQVRELLARLGHQADIRVGTNRSLPFPDGSFDYLVSWNVLHYEDNEADIEAGIQEYHRVLKPGGRFFLSTTGPEHKILIGGETLGGHRYRIGREDDFRKGQVYFYFDSPNYIRHYFSKLFPNVLVGRTHDELLTETLDWFIVSGEKKAA